MPYLTRPAVLFAGFLFFAEALRVSQRMEEEGVSRPPLTFPGATQATIHESTMVRLLKGCKRIDTARLVRRCSLFLAPIVCAFAVVAWLNFVRYGRLTPVYFDHELLNVAWRGRMQKWGLFGYHYFAKNLGIALTSLPWLPPKGGAAAFGAAFKINEHGLALWFTTPLYLWVLWPKALDDQPARKWLFVVLALSATIPALLGLAYQNSGWRQFGYRFSNDYSVLLFVLLAIGTRRMRGLFMAAALVERRVERVRGHHIRPVRIRSLLLSRWVPDDRLPTRLTQGGARQPGGRSLRSRIRGARGPLPD